jgi:hypothetical protein
MRTSPVSNNILMQVQAGRVAPPSNLPMPMPTETTIIEPSIHAQRLERFAALVAAAEREACAKVCEGLSGRSYEFDMGRLHSAAAIRERLKK